MDINPIPSQPLGQTGTAQPLLPKKPQTSPYPTPLTPPASTPATDAPVGPLGNRINTRV